MTQRIYGIPLPIGVTLCDEYTRELPLHGNGFPDLFSLEWDDATHTLTVRTRIPNPKDQNELLDLNMIHLAMKMSNIAGNIPMSNIFKGGAFDTDGDGKSDTIYPYLVDMRELQVFGYMFGKFDLTPSFLSLPNSQNTSTVECVDTKLFKLETDKDEQNDPTGTTYFESTPFPYIGYMDRTMIGNPQKAYYPRYIKMPNIVAESSAMGTVTSGIFNQTTQKHLGALRWADRGSLYVTDPGENPDGERYPSIVRSLLVSLFIKKTTKTSTTPDLYRYINDILVTLHDAINVIFEQTIDKFLGMALNHDLDISTYASLWAAYIASLAPSLENVLLDEPSTLTSIGAKANQIDIDLMAAYRNSEEVRDLIDEMVSLRFEPKMNVNASGFLLNELKEYCLYLYGPNGLNHTITEHEAQVVSEEVAGVVGGAVNLAIIFGAMDAGLRRSSCGLYLRFAYPDFYA